MKELRLLYDCKRQLICSCFLLASVWLGAQEKIQVLDEEGVPLIGVQILIFGENNGFITDELGKVSLSKEEIVGKTLVFQYLGYEELELAISEQSSFPMTITLQSSDLLLDEIILIGRNNEKKSSIIGQVETISARNLEALQLQNTADILASSGEVFVQKSQYGGGSPIMRGFEANKLLLVVDGVRMNNAIYRNGHLQNAMTVDHQSLERVELLFGPGSLVYGSDALGGVIHFRTKNLRFCADGIQRNFNASLSTHSVNRGLGIHLDGSMSSSEFSTYTSISINRFGDLRSGQAFRPQEFPTFGLRNSFVETSSTGQDMISVNENPHLQVGSGYDQFDIIQKIGYKISDQFKTFLNIQYSTSSDVPRYDALIEENGLGELRFSEWYYGPQNRLLLSALFELDQQNKLYDRLSLLLAYQRIDEDRINRRFGNINRIFNEEDVFVNSVNLDAGKLLFDRVSISYGADFQFNAVNSKAYSENVISGEQLNDQLSRYADGNNTLWNTGMFFKTDWYSKNQRLKLSGGMRQSFQGMKLHYVQRDIFEWPEHYYDGIESQTQAFVWNFYGRYSIERSTIRLGLGTAFRAPNVDDLAKIRVNNNEITVPNVDLSPERTQNFELAYQFESERSNFQIVGYQSILKDAIIRDFFSLPDGQTSYLYEGDTLLVTANSNAALARVRGVTLSGNYRLSSTLRSEISVNITEGNVLDENREVSGPLGHIPPWFATGSLLYEVGSWQSMIRYQYFSSKDINDFGGSVDNPDLATPVGSLDYHLLNWNITKKFGEKYMLQFGVDNILDSFYRPFASGVNGPGRNVKLLFKYSI